MPSLRALPLLLVAFLGAAACSKADPGESKPTIVAAPDVAVKGIDTSTLTPRERREWSAELTELLAPCPEVPVNIAQCIQESRPCKSCFPAAQLLLKQVQAGKTKKEREAGLIVDVEPLPQLTRASFRLILGGPRSLIDEMRVHAEDIVPDPAPEEEGLTTRAVLAALAEPLTWLPALAYMSTSPLSTLCVPSPRT